MLKIEPIAKNFKIFWSLQVGMCIYAYRGILVYNICLISISNSVSDGATNKTVLNIERA